jgi:hypothetical protein
MNAQQRASYVARVDAEMKKLLKLAKKYTGAKVAKSL